MKLPKAIYFFSFALVLSFSTFIGAQNLRLKAEENPLSTVFYLLSTTEKDSKEEEKACLATSMVRANRLNEVKDVANLVKKDSYVDKNFVALVNDLIKKGKIIEASKFATYLVKKFEDDEYRLQMMLKPLILLKRDNEALKIIDSFADSDKIDGSFEMAKIYLEVGQSAKALGVIESVKSIVKDSKYGEDKAILGLYYAKLGKDSEAVSFLQESVKNLSWQTGKPEYTEGRILDKVIEIYRTLRKDKEANEILAKQGIIEEPNTQIEIAENFLVEGDLQKAKELYEKVLTRLNPAEYGDSFDFGRLIDIYLKLSEIEKAEKIAKSLTGSDYMQQKQLLNIADIYIKNKNRQKTTETLNFAFEQTKKIDTSEAESGSLWTSGKWDQARYQSQIALRFIDLQEDRKALELISQLQKPYLKALILTEFVSVNKKRLSVKTLSSHLEEALSLLRREKTDIFDSKRFDVLAITARNFAEIGMKEKSADVFAETLSLLDKEMIENGTDSSLLYAMCNIGVEFDNSKIKANKKVKESLRKIIKNWEDDLY